MSWGGHNVSVGPVDDGGVAAWMIDDNIVNNGTARGYLFNQEAQQVADAKAYGWQVDYSVRSVDNPDSQDLAVSIEVGDDERRWTIAMYQDGNGDTEMWFWDSPLSGPTVTVSGAGYHDYRMVYDPTDQLVDVFVNDALVYSDWAGNNDAGTQRVVWGANQSAGVGQGNWSYVGYQVFDANDQGSIPVPGSLLLMFAAGVPGMRRLI